MVRLGRAVVLCLLGAAFVPCRTDALSLSQLRAVVPITYGIYSIIIDRLSYRTLKRMETVEEELSRITNARDLGDDATVPLLTPAQLRKTVSKRTNLVTDSSHRRSWCKWRITTTEPAASNHPSCSTAAPAPTSSRVVEPGHTYTWLYRSYVNSEERNAMRIFLLMHSSTTKMVVHDRNDSDTKNDRTRITLVVTFRLGLVLPVTITWHGTIRTTTQPPQTTATTPPPPPRITWTRTEARIASRVIENPAAAQKLSKEPWDIVKCEDGMVCFQRGDVGYLVFDKLVVGALGGSKFVDQETHQARLLQGGISSRSILSKRHTMSLEVAGLFHRWPRDGGGGVDVVGGVVTATDTAVKRQRTVHKRPLRRQRNQKQNHHHHHRSSLKHARPEPFYHCFL